MNSYRTFLREVVVATAVVVGLSLLARGVRIQPLQVPGYLLVLGFDGLEGALGSAGRLYDVLFGAYLLGLGVVGAAVAHVLKSRLDGEPWWRLAAAGGLGVVGAVSLVSCGVLLFGTGQGVPVLVTGVTGLALLAAASWLAGLFDRDRAPAAT